MALRAWLAAATAAGAAAAAGAAGPRRPPAVAPSWSASFTMGGRSAIRHARGAFFYDDVARRHRWVDHLTFEFAGPETSTLVYDILSDSSSGFNRNITTDVGQNAICKPSHQARYIGPFDGLASGIWRGSNVVDGVACDIWDFNSTDGVSRSSVCLAADNVPRELNTTMDPIFNHVSVHASSGVARFRFSNVSIGPAPAGTFDRTWACAERYPAPPCPGGVAASLDLYRIHSASEPADVGNRNIGDALGDLAFLCARNATLSLGDRLLTHWRVMANTSWDQYSFCFFTGKRNICFSAGRHIGRQSAWGLGSGGLQGQCSSNDDVGSWYSLPAGSRCAGDAPVGTDGCTWGGATAVRTITARCLFGQRGLADACRAEAGHPPYKRALDIFTAAFASDEASRGGCPDARATVAYV